MNRFEKLLGKKRLAYIEFLDGEYSVLSQGDYVMCAISGAEIPLDQLKYWNVERQEAYASAEFAMRAEKQRCGISN